MILSFHFLTITQRAKRLSQKKRKTQSIYFDLMSKFG